MPLVVMMSPNESEHERVANDLKCPCDTGEDAKDTGDDRGPAKSKKGIDDSCRTC